MRTVCLKGMQARALTDLSARNSFSVEGQPRSSARSSQSAHAARVSPSLSASSFAHGAHRRFVFAAETSLEVRRWVEALQIKHVTQFNHVTPAIDAAAFTHSAAMRATSEVAVLVSKSHGAGGASDGMDGTGGGEMAHRWRGLRGHTSVDAVALLAEAASIAFEMEVERLASEGDRLLNLHLPLATSLVSADLYDCTVSAYRAARQSADQRKAPTCATPARIADGAPATPGRINAAVRVLQRAFRRHHLELNWDDDKWLLARPYFVKMDGRSPVAAARQPLTPISLN